MCSRAFVLPPWEDFKKLLGGDEAQAATAATVLYPAKADLPAGPQEQQQPALPENPGAGDTSTERLGAEKLYPPTPPAPGPTADSATGQQSLDQNSQNDFGTAALRVGKTYFGKLTYPRIVDPKTNAREDVPSPWDVQVLSDCSAYVKTVYNKLGVTLDRSSGDQFRDPRFTDVTNDPSTWKAGDLVFFGYLHTDVDPAKTRWVVDHVAMYSGKDANGVDMVYHMGLSGCKEIPMGSAGAHLMGVHTLNQSNIPQK